METSLAPQEIGLSAAFKDFAAGKQRGATRIDSKSMNRLTRLALHVHDLLGAAAGALGGMVGVVAGQPLDTVRIRMQQQSCKQRSITAMWRSILSGEGTRYLMASG